MFKVVSEVKTITRDEFIAAWVSDLRSGEFQQGRGSLFNDSGYCCLGVACMTAQRLGIPLIESPVEGTSSDQVMFNGEANYLPEVLAEALGMERHGTFSSHNGKGTQTLANLNDGIGGDGRQVPFIAIAAIIEARPDGLFTEVEPDAEIIVPVEKPLSVSVEPLDDDAQAFVVDDYGELEPIAEESPVYDCSDHYCTYPGCESGAGI